ncbi:ABC transporter ATP-binding protein [Pedobacter xixiisoli]|uniref:ABC-type polysaccharide/polyol phosphate transport system, ATPase component n=1 Tax=Pedobacter xixiisoli TaxID=1476464 RepID=A0A286A9R6_9SPHI|nr:ABC transporter ATP-binding protein [Pedobacter xixiisoli]SOD18658.1 ABC-type polysaccharide/polyol phosphate transport system, ATPase component [Pedobacter xixiisoli]
MSNTIIKVENLSKAYQLGEIGTGTISRDLERWYARLRGKEDPFLRIGETNNRNIKGNSDISWSLKDINFEIEQGDAVGIIGPNGAGKSTLLKILSRVTSPTSGRIIGKGRIASLLEVGTGFHPELTGRENIYLNGAILGMRRKEITKKFDEIVDFAGVERYIDTPVKRYSSGMYVRLAFAVAAYLDSEILVIDEVLAVGDAEFQQKCLGKMGEISKGEGRTVLFVSHNMGSIAELCNKAILLRNGQLIQHGDAQQIINRYINNEENQQSVWHKSSEKFSSQFFDLLSFYIVNEHKEMNDTGVARNDAKTGVCLKFNTNELNADFCYGIAFYDQHETLLYWSYQTDKSKVEWLQPEIGTNQIIIWLPQHMLNQGSYRIRPLASLHYIKWLVAPNAGPSIHLKILGGLSNSPIWNDARPGLLAPVLDFERI